MTCRAIRWTIISTALKKKLKNKMTIFNQLFDDTIKRWHNREHYGYQREITQAIIGAVEQSKTGQTIEIPIELPRQSGKTTAIVDVNEFLLAAPLRFFNHPLS